MNTSIPGNENAVTDSDSNEKMDKINDDNDNDDHRSLSLDSLQRKKKAEEAEFTHENHTSSLTLTSCDGDFFEESKIWSRDNNNRNSNNRQERRRASQLSDITYESDDQQGVSDLDAQTTDDQHIASDLDAQTTDDQQFTSDFDAHTMDSNDSSWADNYSALLHTASLMGGQRFSLNETSKAGIEDGQRPANTAAPVIPRRRVSVNINQRGMTAADINTSTENDGRTVTKANAAAPTIPQRSSSHTSKLSSNKKYTQASKSNSFDSASFADNMIFDGRDYNSGDTASFAEDAVSIGGRSSKSIASGTNQDINTITTKTALSATTNSESTINVTALHIENENEHYQYCRSSNGGSHRDLLVAGNLSVDPPIAPARRASRSAPLCPTEDEEESREASTKDAQQLFLSHCRIDDSENDDSYISRRNACLSSSSTNASPRVKNNKPPEIPLRTDLDSPWPNFNPMSRIYPEENVNEPPTCPIRKYSSHKSNLPATNTRFSNRHSFSTISASISQSSNQPPALPKRRSSDSTPCKNLPLLESPSSSTTVTHSMHPSSSQTLEIVQDEISNQAPTIPMRKDSNSTCKLSKNNSMESSSAPRTEV